MREYRLQVVHAFVLMTVFACAATGCFNQIKMSEDVFVDSSIALTIQKSDIGAESLRVRATLANNGTREIFYVCHLCSGWDDSGMPILEPSAAYRVITDGRVELVRSFVPVPDDIDLEVVQFPLFASLKGGGSVEINIELPLPTFPYTPYDFEEFDKESATACSLPWSLEIGYVDGKAFLSADPEEAITSTGEKGLQVFALDQSILKSVKHFATTTIPVLSAKP